MSAVAKWADVVEFMRERAKATDDPFLYYIAESADGAVHDHVVDSGGCAACKSGECGAWEYTQELLIIWLLEQVAG